MIMDDGWAYKNLWKKAMKTFRDPLEAIWNVKINVEVILNSGTKSAKLIQHSRDVINFLPVKKRAKEKKQGSKKEQISTTSSAV